MEYKNDALKLPDVAENSVSAAGVGAETRISDLVRLFADRTEAAKVADVSVAQLHRYMNGKSQAPFGAIARMAVAKDVRMEWVWTGEGPMRDDRISEASASYGSAALDAELLQNVLLLMEKVVKEEELDRTPAQKARFVAGIYGYLLGKEALDKSEVEKVVRLVVSNAA